MPSVARFRHGAGSSAWESLRPSEVAEMNDLGSVAAATLAEGREVPLTVGKKDCSDVAVYHGGLYPVPLCPRGSLSMGH